MKKFIKDFIVNEICQLSPKFSLLKLRPADGSEICEVLPGQFVQVAVDSSKTTFLRRPISICNVDAERNELWLLVREAGAGTAALVRGHKGDVINLLYPLGNGFSLNVKNGNILLIGGGVGVAPMFLLGKELKASGKNPEFLIGARSEKYLLLSDEIAGIGKLHISTDDGTAGEKGLVTENTVLAQPWDMIYCCGPAPMMKAVAAVARNIGAQCEVSLENMMACGLGACLCCVEKTVKGNVCVCTEGPVFNIDELTW